MSNYSITISVMMMMIKLIKDRRKLEIIYNIQSSRFHVFNNEQDFLQESIRMEDRYRTYLEIPDLRLSNSAWRSLLQFQHFQEFVCLPLQWASLPGITFQFNFHHKNLSLSQFTWMVFPKFGYGVTLKFLIQDVNIQLQSSFMGCWLIWPF